MSAKATAIEVFEHRKDWEDLFWILAENDIVKFKEIRRLEVVQFYSFLERWKEIMRKKMENAKKQNQIQNGK